MDYTNDTDDMYVDYEEFNTDGTNTVRFLTSVIYGIAGIVGIPGNVFVLVALFGFRDMRTISNMYIFNLAVADLLFLLGVPIIITQSVQRSWTFGRTMCKLFLSMNGISQFASAAFIGVLSFDRYLAVCRPVQATEWRTVRAAVVISLAAWIMVAVEMTPLFVFSTTLPNFEGGETCQLAIEDYFPENLNQSELLKFIEQEGDVITQHVLLSRLFFTTYTFALSYLLPLLAVWFFYVNIIQRMWVRRRQFFNRKKTVKRTTTKVSILGLAIVISYTLCWLPFWTIQWSIVLEIGLARHPELLVKVSHFAYTLQYVNSAVNPFLYVFMSDAFRRNLTVNVSSKILRLFRRSSAFSYTKAGGQRAMSQGITDTPERNTEACQILLQTTSGDTTARTAVDATLIG